MKFFVVQVYDERGLSTKRRPLLHEGAHWQHHLRRHRQPAAPHGGEHHAGGSHQHSLRQIRLVLRGELPTLMGRFYGVSYLQ